MAYVVSSRPVRPVPSHLGGARASQRSICWFSIRKTIKNDDVQRSGGHFRVDGCANLCQPMPTYANLSAFRGSPPQTPPILILACLLLDNPKLLFHCVLETNSTRFVTNIATASSWSARGRAGQARKGSPGLPRNPTKPKGLKMEAGGVSDPHASHSSFSMIILFIIGFIAFCERPQIPLPP